MALIKEKMTNYGLVASYWKVGMITIDRIRKEASYSLNLYFDREAEQFIETYSVSLLGLDDKTEFEQYFNNGNFPNICTACYEHAKAKEDFFADAIDEV